MEQKTKLQVTYLTVKNIQCIRQNTAEQIFAQIKETFGKCRVRLRGHATIMSHQIFGFIVLLF